MESEATSSLAEADSLRDAARLEDLHLWKMEKEFDSKNGRKRYEYWMASWGVARRFITRILAPARSQIGKPPWRRPGGSRLRIWG
jgi:hypothetical protein